MKLVGFVNDVTNNVATIVADVCFEDLRRLSYGTLKYGDSAVQVLPAHQHILFSCFCSNTQRIEQPLNQSLDSTLVVRHDKFGPLDG